MYFSFPLFGSVRLKKYIAQRRKERKRIDQIRCISLFLFLAQCEKKHFAQRRKERKRVDQIRCISLLLFLAQCDKKALCTEKEREKEVLFEKNINNHRYKLINSFFYFYLLTHPPPFPFILAKLPEEACNNGIKNMNRLKKEEIFY